MRAAVVLPTLAMVAVLTVASMAIFTVAVFAPEAAADIGVAATDIGVFTAIVYIVAMFSGAITGELVARYGAVRVSQLALGFTAVAMAVLALATPLAAAFAAIGLGLCYGMLNPSSAHILIKIATARWRALVFSFKQTGVPIGGALAGLCVPVLVVAIGWRGAALGVSILALIVIGSIEPLRRRLDERGGGSRGWSVAGVFAPLRLVWRTPMLRRFAIVGFGFAGVQVSIGAFYVVFLNEELGMSLVAAGAILAFVQAGGIAGRIVWGAVAGRWLAPRWVLAVLGMLTTVCLVLTSRLTVEVPLAAMAALGLVLGASSFGWNGVFLSELPQFAPEGRAGEATGGVQFVFFGGVVLVPPCFGAVVSLSGHYHAAFLTTAALALVAGVYLLFPLARSAPQRSG